MKEVTRRSSYPLQLWSYFLQDLHQKLRNSPINPSHTMYPVSYTKLITDPKIATRFESYGRRRIARRSVPRRDVTSSRQIPAASKAETRGVRRVVRVQRPRSNVGTARNPASRFAWRRVSISLCKYRAVIIGVETDGRTLFRGALSLSGAF